MADHSYGKSGPSTRNTRCSSWRDASAGVGVSIEPEALEVLERLGDGCLSDLSDIELSDNEEDIVSEEKLFEAAVKTFQELDNEIQSGLFEEPLADGNKSTTNDDELQIEEEQPSHTESNPVLGPPRTTVNVDRSEKPVNQKKKEKKQNKREAKRKREEEMPEGITARKNIKWDAMGTSMLEPPKADWKEPTRSEVITPDNPIDYFKKYIDDDLIKKMADMTNIYALQNNDTNFKPTNSKEIEVLLGLHIAMGILKFPRIRLYWDVTLKISLFRESMTRNRFFKLRNNLHVVNNLEISPENTDKFKKVRPVMDSVLKRCRSLEGEKKMCVDEQIIPFKGTHLAKQYNPKKPSPWGLKLYVLSGESGIVYNFIMYQGKSTEIDREQLEDYGLGPSVILHLIEHSHANACNPGSELYFDNYFSSYHLFQVLKMNEIRAAGTARVDRFNKPPFEEELKRKTRGAMQEVVSKDRDVIMVRWYDNKPVTMVSNFVGVGETDVVERWDKNEKRYVAVERPEVIRLYNKSMGGVDKTDFLLALYRIFIRSRKWPLRVIFHFIDLSISNAWLEYRQDCKSSNVLPKNSLDLLGFRLSVVTSLLSSGKSTPLRKRGRPTLEEIEDHSLNSPRLPLCNMEVRPVQDIRFGGKNHLPIHCEKKEAGRCKRENCSGRSHFRCEKCKVYLCLSKARNCFREFHI